MTPTSPARRPDSLLQPLIDQKPSTLRSVTPPPSSQDPPTQWRAANTPEPTQSHLSSPPPSTVLRSRDRYLESDGYNISEKLHRLTAEELRRKVTQLMSEAHDAKATAAHYKLQHQMSQMESGEAIERMAVEMDMAKREIEVLQQAETQRQISERAAQAIAPEDDETQFRKVHVDIYSAMMDEIKDLKLANSHMEREVISSRSVIEQQENEIASLSDKVLLMRERIKESRDQLFKFRRDGRIDSSPYPARFTPYQTPVRERFRPLHPQVDLRSQLPTPQYRPQAPLSQQPQQEGFAALLQATDIVSQGGETPATSRHKGHTRAALSLSSLPSTPSRSVAKPVQPPLYTPTSRPRQQEVPQTAPLPRKRAMDSRTPPGNEGGYESQDTESAVEDSEAETEVDDGGLGESRATRYARDLLRSPTAKRAKSAHNLKSLTQTRLFGSGSKASGPGHEATRDNKRTRVEVERDVGLGIAATGRTSPPASPS